MRLLHVLENTLTLPWRINFRLGQGFGGTKIILTGAWSANVATYIKYRKISELDLCYIKSDTCCDFLRGQTHLTGLRFCGRPKDVSILNGLTKLKYLDLGYGPKPSGSIDFHNFQFLELLYTDWHPGFESIFDCSNLKNLAIEKFSGNQGSALFANLTKLRRLWLSCCGLEEIENFKVMSELESLDLLNMSHLRSLRGIEGLTNLKRLRIESCKNIGDIEPVQNLQNLEFLSVSDCGNIASLEPLRNLTKLETLQFYESTNILDGKLGPLEKLPKLRVLQFKERKHYDRKRQNFRQAQ